MTQRSMSGFTIIELMLSMAFIGGLLVAIAVTSMHIARTYTKGITVREVNQAGRTIVEDMQRTTAMSVPFSVDKKTGSSDDPIDSKYVDMAGRGGRLCTGTYTYAWNYGTTRELSGRTDADRQQVYNVYTSGGDDIRMAKVRDIGGVLCSDLNSQIDRDNAKELLSAGDRNLAIQKLALSSDSRGRDSVSGQSLYYVSITLGTNSVASDYNQLNASHTECLPPSEGDGYDDYCSINRFDFIIRSGNRSGSL